jgi:regulatory protein
MASENPPLARAKAIALRYLASRARTTSQVRARLAKDGLEDHADAVVEWLRRLGYLDDAAFALAAARSLLTHGRAGPRLAARRLAAAGIAPAAAREVIAAAVQDAAADGGGELSLCRALAERRAKRPVADLDDRGRRRLARFLLGRGFAGPVVARVLGLWDDA